MVDVLEPLTSEQTEWLAQRTPERTFQAGDIVYAAGAVAEVIYLLLSGSVRLYGMAGAQELTFDVIRTGTMFGEAALLEHTHDEYAQALEPSLVALLTLPTFQHLAGQNPEVNACVVKLLGKRLRLHRRRMIDISLRKVPARLANLILALIQSEGVVTGEGHYKIPTRYTHEHLASMIGAKRVAVSKAFGDLQDSGCLQLWRRQIYITDLATLKAWVTAD